MPDEEFAKFNLELWNTGELQLTTAQDERLPILKEILVESKLAIAKVIAEAQCRGWRPIEMRALEEELLAKVGKGPILKQLFDILAKVAYRHRLLQKLKPQDSPLPRPMLPVKLEKNPFREPDFIRHEQIVFDLRSWVKREARELANNDEELPEKFLPFAILSCIANFHILHESVVVALIEALADHNSSWVGAGRNAGGWLLSLSWGGVDDEERRLLLPDALSGVLLARVSEDYVRTVFQQQGLDRKQPLKARHKFILSTIDLAIQSLLVESVVLREARLKDLLEAGQMASYFHLPAAVAALRCRKTVSHSTRKEVLSRIFVGSEVGDQRTTKGPNISSAEMEECIGPEISDRSQLSPEWIGLMRRAFRRKKVLRSQSEALDGLDATANTSDPAGRVIVEFAIHLLGGRGTEQKVAVSTAERYSLLIARRLGERLEETDPSTIPAEELGDHYCNVLEDDWEDSNDENLPAPKNKRPTVEALRLFQKFLEDQYGAPKLEEELASALRRRGLLPVDANFITVDEYQQVLKAIHLQGPPDRNLRIMLWLNVVFGFRCGLRRREAFYLRVEDFDDAEHLYIRSYKLRKVKTSNSNRAIPYGLLLSDGEPPFDEIGELTRFIGHRKTGLLFADDKGRLLMPEEKAFDQIHTIMRGVLGDRTLRFHHLRHSFATLLAAKFFSGTKSFSDQYLGRRHPVTVEWLSDRQDFRLKLFGCDDRTMLGIQAISHLLGHGSCAVGVENYIHSLDWFAGGPGGE